MTTVGGRVVIVVAAYNYPLEYLIKLVILTTLAWDVGKALSDVLYFEGEVIIGWEGPRDRESFGYDHAYCLVFSNR